MYNSIIEFIEKDTTKIEKSTKKTDIWRCCCEKCRTYRQGHSYIETLFYGKKVRFHV